MESVEPIGLSSFLNIISGIICGNRPKKNQSFVSKWAISGEKYFRGEGRVIFFSFSLFLKCFYFLFWEKSGKPVIHPCPALPKYSHLQSWSLSYFKSCVSLFYFPFNHYLEFRVSFSWTLSPTLVVWHVLFSICWSFQDIRT